MRFALLLVPFALSAFGCDKVVGSAHADEGTPKPPKPVASAAKSAEPAPSAPAEACESGTRYGVPFGWEISKDEPLAKARSYLGD
ncbi:MAG TPA: hypothetical protein VGQ57_18730, partial [Polyangiaceae bacterium]|nr:hypothetical protein [Polyangiaceae bacterium]